jgi:hypothetical protein
LLALERNSFYLARMGFPRRLALPFAAWVSLALCSAASAAPKTYVFTGKLTSSRGVIIDIPLIGSAPCNGVGQSNLTVGMGPGGAVVPAPNTPPGPFPGANADFFGCVPHVPGKKITTTGAGAGGAFVMPTMVFSKPFGSYVAAINVGAAPAVQLATSFRITGPVKTATKPIGGSMVMTFAPAAFHAFKKSAWMTQTGRGGQAFTWCFGNPNCAKVTQGTKPLIVKYKGGGGNAFGGTMSYVITAKPNSSSLAIGAGGGAIGFALLSGMGSQPTGRGYASSLTDMLAKGPLWGAYKTMTVTRPRVGKQKLITMVTGFLGNNFPAAYNYNFGFPWTTMTVLARNTGTLAGNPRVTTLTAKGGDTVTAKGKRNINLIAGGLARAVIGPAIGHVPEIAQMYLPEPGRAAQLVAGAGALLAIGAWRGFRRH